MTTTIANYSGTDITDLTCEQAGTSRAEIFLEEPLLDATKTYMISVSELAVPLSEEPMLTYNLLRARLLSVRRRRVGQNITQAVNTTVGGAYFPDLTIPEDLSVYTASDFISFVSQWASAFSRQVWLLGLAQGYAVTTIPPNNVNLEPNRGNAILQIGLTPSGVLSFRGTEYFWVNFYIEAFPYAQSLLGITYSQIALRLNNHGEYLRDPAFLAGADNIILASGILIGTVKIVYNLDHSVFRFLEERMYVTLEVSDLAIPLNQLIRDGVETRTHELASFPIETKYRTSIKIENAQVTSAVELELDTHISRVHFISKNQPTYSWYPLKSAYMIQNMRMELFMTRRMFSPATGKWIYSREPLRINSEAVWNASLKFISVH